MFVRFIIITAVIHFSKCWKFSLDRSLNYPDDYSLEESNETPDIFDTTVNIVSEIDENLEKTCRFQNSTAIEKLDQVGYTRKISLAGFNKDTVSVKIKGRVLFTKVDHICRDRRGIIDMTILPHNLDNTQATYEILNDNLYVNIPYTQDFLDLCHHKVYDKMVTVLPYNSNEVPNDDDENENSDLDIRYNIPQDTYQNEVRNKNDYFSKVLDSD